VYRHRYDIYPGLETGMPSVATASDAWEASRYEKDGSTLSLGSLLGFASEASVIEDVGYATTQVLDSRTLVRKGATKARIPFRSNSIYLTETYECLDDSCSEMTVTIHEFESDGDDETTKTRKAESFVFMKKVSEETWINQFQQSMKSYNVLPDYRVEIPMKGQCMTGKCNMSEEWWCQYDPACSGDLSVEKYSATLNTGMPRALLIIVSLLVCIAVSYVRSRQNRTRRCRAVLARSLIVRTGKSYDELTPDAIRSMFKQILTGSDSGSIITVEDLNAFFSSSRDIVDTDLTAFLHSIDPQNSGIDFPKFCMLISSLKTEFDALTQQEIDELRKLELA